MVHVLRIGREQRYPFRTEAPEGLEVGQGGRGGRDAGGWDAGDADAGAGNLVALVQRFQVPGCRLGALGPGIVFALDLVQPLLALLGFAGAFVMMLLTLVAGQEIKNGAQLIVRESQTAVFVYEGQVADVFTPGRYTIDGGNRRVLFGGDTVILRKAYGAGLYAMAGPAFEPEATLALPTARIAVMGPEAAVNLVFRRELQGLDDPTERRKELIGEYQHLRQAGLA